MTRPIFWIVVGLAVLVDATGHDGFHFIACAALILALDRERAA